MPPRKQKPKKILPEIPPATSQFEYINGFPWASHDSPPLLRQIPVPIGTIGCLNGLSFVVTGTMPSLYRNELKDIIEKYGGRVSTSISGKTDIVIRGCRDVGPKKIQEAMSRKIPIIDQAGLFTIIAKSNPDYRMEENEEKKEDMVENEENVNENEQKNEELLLNNLMFSEKYRPRKLSEVVGNIGPIFQLKEWLENYPKRRKKHPIALVTGPCGVGKTTVVYLLAKEFNYSVIEINGSHAMSKNFLTNIGYSTDNYSICLDNNDNKMRKKNIIVFEDVDMFPKNYGTLIDIARKTKTPIICISNNRINLKLEEIAKVSIDVRFHYPKIDEVRQRLSYVCQKENIDLEFKVLDRIVNISKFDVRFALNTLQFWNKKKPSAKDEAIKDIFDASQCIFSKLKSIDEKTDAFFYDYNQIPSYIEYNLPVPKLIPPPNLLSFRRRKEMKKDVSKTNQIKRTLYADSFENIALGNTIEQCIHEYQTYDLLNAQSIISSILPASNIDPSVTDNSIIIPKSFTASKKQQKFNRYHNEISGRILSSIPTNELYDTTIYLLYEHFISLFDLTKIEQLINKIEDLGLTLEDVDHIMELVLFEKRYKKNDKLMKEISKIYRKRHLDEHKKIMPESDIHELYLIRQISGPKKAIK